MWSVFFVTEKKFPLIWYFSSDNCFLSPFLLNKTKRKSLNGTLCSQIKSYKLWLPACHTVLAMLSNKVIMVRCPDDKVVVISNCLDHKHLQPGILWGALHALLQDADWRWIFLKNILKIMKVFYWYWDKLCLVWKFLARSIVYPCHLFQTYIQ